MTHLHQLAADAGLQGRSADSPTNSVPAIPHAHLQRIFNTHRPVVDDRPDLYACLSDTPAPHRGFAVLIGAACSWLAVFCVAYFAAELIRGLVRVWL